MMWPLGNKNVSPAGLALSGDSMALAQLRRSQAGWQLSAAGVLPRCRQGGPELNAEEAALLARCFRRLGVVGRRVVVAVPDKHLHAAVLDAPSRDSGAPVDQIAAEEMARMYGYSPGEAETHCEDLPPSPRSKGALQVLAMSCIHQEADRLLESIERAGLEVIAMDSRPAALRRACAMAKGASDQAALDLDCDGATMVFVHQGAIVYVRHMPQAGLTAVKARVAQRLGLDADSVGCLVSEVGPGTPQDCAEARCVPEISAAVRECLDGVAAEWHSLADYVTQTYPRAKIERLYVTGSGAAVRGAAEYLHGKLGLPVEILPLSALVGCPGNMQQWAGDTRLTASVALARYFEEAN